MLTQFSLGINWYLVSSCNWHNCFYIYRGSLIGHPVEGIRIVLTDGASHAVDSSELAFKLASIYAFRKVFLIYYLYRVDCASTIDVLSHIYLLFFLSFNLSLRIL